MLINVKESVIYNKEPLSERELQKYVFDHMKKVFQIRPLCTEYELELGPNKKGRIDVLGVKEDGTLVIFELKSAHSRTILNQAIEYRYHLLRQIRSVATKLSEVYEVPAIQNHVEIICIAGEFSDRDYALTQSAGCPIQLCTYEYYAPDFISFESVNYLEQLEHLDGLANSDFLLNFLTDVARYIVKNPNYTKTTLSADDVILRLKPQSTGPGQYGNKVKNTACIYGQVLVLMRVDQLINVLKEDFKRQHDAQMIKAIIDAEFEASMRTVINPNNLVLAPKQYKTKQGFYTAFSYEQLCVLCPEYDN